MTLGLWPQFQATRAGCLYQPQWRANRSAGAGATYMRFDTIGAEISPSLAVAGKDELVAAIRIAAAISAFEPS